MRNRIVQIIALLLVVALGIFSRTSRAAVFPAFLTTYAGDTMWALALFLFLGILFPRIGSCRLLVLTLTISYAVELSQLYQAEWVNTMRGTRVGGLILGFGFKWSDLACYTVGGLIGFFGERYFARNL